MAKTTSSTGSEPNVIDNVDYSETTEIFLQGQSSDTHLHDAELGDETINSGLSHSVNTTPEMTRFRGAKVCSKWLQERIDDHTIGLKV